MRNVHVAADAAISLDKTADGATRLALTADERAKLATVATGATAYTSENARDDIASALVAGSGVTITPNDGADTITIAASGAGATAPVVLSDAATVSLNAAAGRLFRLAAGGNRTIAAPTGATDGAMIVIAHQASGAARTLTLATGSAGSFAFGTTVTGLSATTAGATDYIGCIYDGTSQRWRVASYVKGFA